MTTSRFIWSQDQNIQEQGVQSRLRLRKYWLTFTELWVRRNISSASLYLCVFWSLVYPLFGRVGVSSRALLLTSRIPGASAFPKDVLPHQSVLPFFEAQGPLLHDHRYKSHDSWNVCLRNSAMLSNKFVFYTSNPWRSVFWVNLRRLKIPVTQSNANLGVTLKVFHRCV